MHLTSNRGSTFCTYQPECHCKVKGESEEEKGERRREGREGGRERGGRTHKDKVYRIARFVPSEKSTPRFMLFMSFSSSRSFFPANCSTNQLYNYCHISDRGIRGLDLTGCLLLTCRPVREMKRRRISLLPSNILKMRRSLKTRSSPHSWTI